MTAMRVFVDMENQATFICPSCGKASPIDVSAAEEGQIETETVCTCGHRESVIIDLRRAPRMTVVLSGEIVQEGEGPRPISVRILSRLGLGFEVAGPPAFKIGDEITIEIFLEDMGAAVIRKTAVVRNSDGRFVGAEFLTKENPSGYDAMCDQTLDAYTRFAE